MQNPAQDHPRNASGSVSGSLAFSFLSLVQMCTRQSGPRYLVRLSLAASSISVPSVRSMPSRT